MDYQTLKFEITDGVGVITLNRPDNANALDLTMASELHDVALRCEFEDEIRAVC